MKVVVVGAGGHGTVVCDTLLAAGHEVLGFVDDNREMHGRELLSRPVLGTLDALGMAGCAALVIGIGNNAVRHRCFSRARGLGYEIISAVHPTAIRSPYSAVGAGAMVMAGVVVNVGADIGEDVILNTSSTIDHHCAIGAHAHVGPGVTMGGAVRLGVEVFVGAGAVLLPGVTIGDRAVVGAGAVVRNDLPADCTAVGVPARVIRTGTSA
jgi:UDP-perosamine 4-acetyltransferase